MPVAAPFFAVQLIPLSGYPLAGTIDADHLVTLRKEPMVLPE